MIRRAWIYGTCLLALGLGMAAEAGDRPASRRAMAFVQMGAGPRAFAMGEAFSGLADDINTLSWNPAGIARMSDPQILFMHNQWIANMKQEYLSFAYPLSLGCAALQLSYFNADSQLRRDEYGNVSGDGFQPYSALGGVGFASQLDWGLSAGATLNYAREQLDDLVYQTGYADLGAYYRMPQACWSLGAAVQHLGLPVAGYPLPLTFRCGAAASFLEDSLNVNAEVARTLPGWFRYGVGAEFWYLNIFALRAGYVFRPEHEQLEALSGLRAGLGFNIQGYQLDYAVTPQGDLGYGHRASLTYFFGGGRALASEKQTLIAEARRCGQQALQARQYSSAIDYFQKVLTFVPDDRTAKSGLQNAMEGFRKSEEERELQNRFSRAEKFERAGELQDAMEEYRRILLIAENNVPATQALNRIQSAFNAQSIERNLKKGREAFARMLWADALLAWQAVLDVDPQHAEAKAMLEKTRAEMEKGGKGFKDPRIKEWYLAGLQRFEKGDYPGAIGFWKKVLKIAPQHAQTQKTMQEAERIIAELIARWLSSGRNYFQAQDLVRAAASWRKVLTLELQHAEAKSLLAQHAEVFRSRAKEQYLSGIQAYTLGNFKQSIANWEDVLTLVPQYPGAQENIDKAKEKLRAIQ